MSRSASNSSNLLPALHHALSGSAGTLISTCTTYPLSLVVTRLQVQRQLARGGRLAEADAYDGIADAFSRIWRDGEPSASGATTPRSIAALYTGLTQDISKSMLESFLFFLFYEAFRSWSRGGGRRTGARGIAEELAIGVAAGATSRALTAPISNVVTRKQTAAMVDGEAGAGGLSVKEIVREIVEEKGIMGLWSGYSATLVLTLNPSITFLLQDLLKRVLLKDAKLDDPGMGLTFLLAATSKAIASTITYPFQTAKARLQAGMPVESASETPDESEKQQEGKEKKHADDLIELNDPDAAKSDASDRPIDKEIDAKLKATRAIRNFARQSIFGTIAQIVQTEGAGSLYDGIHAELIKGFFSHGTTMLAKGVVHKLLFKLYFVVAGIWHELRLRRQRRELDVRKHGESRTVELPRALRFKSLASHEARSRPDATSTAPRGNPSLFSRLISSLGRNNVKDVPTESKAGIILNFQDRSQRGFNEK